MPPGGMLLAQVTGSPSGWRASLARLARSQHADPGSPPRRNHPGTPPKRRPPPGVLSELTQHPERRNAGSEDYLIVVCSSSELPRLEAAGLSCCGHANPDAAALGPVPVLIRVAICLRSGSPSFSAP